MHFTVLYVMENQSLDQLKNRFGEEGVINKIYNEFGTLYCDGCGEWEPENFYICDWFQIGGRWLDLLPAKKGITGEGSFMRYASSTNGNCSICDIEDLDENFDFEKTIYGVATDTDYYETNWRDDSLTDDMKEWFNKIRTKQIKGVVALIDCHS